MAFIFLSRTIHRIVFGLALITVLLIILAFPKFYNLELKLVQAVGASYTVDSTSDGTANASHCENGTPSGGDCTLRDAIAAVNATSTSATISFSFNTNDANYYCHNSSDVEVNIADSGSGTCSGSVRWWKIKPTSTLQTITNNAGVTINGYSQTGSSPSASIIGSDAVLNIEIDGTSAGSSNNGNGLYSTASNLTINGLVINSFYGCGISTTGDDSYIQGNYLGTDVTGLIDKGNGGKGVCIGAGASGNTIGGTSVGFGNLISGNNEGGVVIGGVGAQNNVVVGNYIGLKINGTAALANSGNGVGIESGGTGNTIGGTSASSRNYISGNSQSGVAISSGANSNTVQGNYIGLNVAGTAAIANSSDGVRVSSASNTIGGSIAGAGNVISGNSGVGVSFNASTATGNTIAGNYIGLNSAGTAALANSNSGVYLSSGSSSNTVGSTSSLGRNVISGNDANGSGGIRITGSSDNNTIIGNYVGLNAAGTSAVGNKAVGIYVQRSSGNVIGGVDSSYRNVVAGTTNGYGIGLDYATSTIVSGNYVGTDAAGTTELGNSDAGIASNSYSVTIGGSSGEEGNVVRGNSTYGIKLFGGTSSTVTYNSVFHNTKDQVYLDETSTGNTLSNNTIGNSDTSTNTSGTFVISYTTFSANGNVYDSCGESSGCLLVADTGVNNFLNAVTSDNTNVSTFDGTNSFHLWMGVLSDLPGIYFSILVRNDQFSTVSAATNFFTANLGAGTATANYFETNVLVAGASATDSYTFKGISNFTNSGVSISSGTTSPMTLAYGANSYYGYNILGISNTFARETCLNIGNCFLFNPTTDAAFTVTSSTLTSVGTYGFRTAGSATVNLTIQDTPVSVAKISRAASGGTITQKFNTRAYVTDSNGVAVGSASVEFGGGDSGSVNTLSTDVLGYTAYVNRTVYTVGASGTMDDRTITVELSKSGLYPTQTSYVLDSAYETFETEFEAEPESSPGVIPGGYNRSNEPFVPPKIPSTTVPVDVNAKEEYYKIDPMLASRPALLDKPILVKYPADPKIYLLDNNRKRHIKDEKVFLHNGFDWSQVKVISPNEVIAEGPLISNKIEKAVGQPISKILKLGQKGSQVRRLQDILRRAGYLSFVTTGNFGNITREALTNFQKDNGLATSGMVDAITMDLLNRFLDN